MTPAAHATLAPEAAAQRDSRAASYPALVAAGKVKAAEAEADWQAWVAIHAWLESGRLPAWAEWPDCAAAARRAVAQGEKATIARAGDEAFAARLAAVRVILRAIEARATFYAETTAALRAEARAKAA